MNYPRLGVCTLAACLLGGLPAAAAQPPATCGAPPPPGASVAGQQVLDLSNLLGAGRLRGANRDVARAAVGGAVQVSQHEGPGVVWLAGTDFGEGTLEVDVCGRNIPQLSFVGLAFHLRVVVTKDKVTVFAGHVATPALTVRRLGHGTTGLVGLWVGNNSDGVFANLRIGR